MTQTEQAIQDLRDAIKAELIEEVKTWWADNSQGYIDNEDVYAVGEAAELLGEKKDTIRQRLHRAGTEPVEYINPREPVYYPEDLGLGKP